MILAVDTSSALSSVALLDGDSVVAERWHDDPRRHAEVTAPLLAQVLEGVDRARITAAVCGVGPGPYTGLRVGIATCRAIGAAWDIPVHGVCSLDAVAAAVRGTAEPADGPLGIALDARRREVYWAVYDSGGRRLEGPRVGPPAGIPQELRRTGRWAGVGAVANADAFGRVIAPAAPTDATVLPHAAWIARHAATLLAAGHSLDPVDLPLDVHGGDPVDLPLDVHGGDPVDLPLDVHGSDSGATARALGGAGLLAPMPLYLRSPDVTLSPMPGGAS